MALDPNHKVVPPPPAQNAAYGKLGWRCDQCGAITWAELHSKRPGRCSTCGSYHFASVEVWPDHVRLSRLPYR
jgi:DNA-directed RNA polymerase subunit RPC12/RpoP